MAMAARLMELEGRGRCVVTSRLRTGGVERQRQKVTLNRPLTAGSSAIPSRTPYYLPLA